MKIFDYLNNIRLGKILDIFNLREMFHFNKKGKLLQNHNSDIRYKLHKFQVLHLNNELEDNQVDIL
jgi:hypothetical protein